MEDTCKYCDKPVFKTNGKAEPICEKRAYTGKCTGHQPRQVIKLPGRNDKCGCGSGKKFKNCCMAAMMETI